MITYHPALDIYHTSFRQLVVAASDPNRSFESERLYICAFYVLFPELIRTIRFPASLTKWKKRLTLPENPYFSSGSPRSLFARLEVLNESASSMLIASSLLRLTVDKRILMGTPNSLPAPLRSRISRAILASGAIFEFMRELNSVIALDGKDGLKDRSGLLEFKYDAI
jgi:hypothetical protein